jgi:hypothetical protein
MVRFRRREPRLITLSCRFRAEQVEALKAIQRRTGATVAEQVRRAVDLWLQRKPHVR